MIFPQLVANSLIAGSIVALVVAGFSLIYTTNRFAHFAHGGVVVVAGYILYSFSSLLHWPFWLSAILTLVTSSLLGWLLFFTIYLRLLRRRASSVILLIASLAILILLENLLLVFFGASVKSLSVLPVQKGIEILGAIVTPLQISIIGTSILLFFGLFLFSKYSHLGKVMRAVSDNQELAKISGIAIERVQGASFIIGSALAGVAGILIALEQSLSPTMGTNLIIKGFTGAVIGGSTSLAGSILGSYVLGLVENFGIWFLPSAWKNAIAFAVLLLFLLLRPEGILGVRRRM